MLTYESILFTIGKDNNSLTGSECGVCTNIHKQHCHKPQQSDGGLA